MRQSILLLLLTIFGQVSKGQNLVIEDSCYLSDNTILQNYNLPIIRTIYGGSKIIPIFEGNWTNEAKGAFRHACLIWEEVIPTTYPIKIRAIMDENRNVSNNTISKFTTVCINDFFHWTPRSLNVQVKAMMFTEKTGKYNSEFYKDVIDSLKFYTPEIELTYYNKNNRLYDMCSFSLEGVSEADKYDFVTIVMRDIAMSLGLTCSFTKNQQNQLTINEDYLTPFENDIYTALGRNQQTAYLLATQGEVNVDGYKLYAPTTWDRNLSLKYFIPDSTCKLTQLLTYNFGKGSVIRDIVDDNTNNIFKEILKWKGDIATGNNTSTNGSLNVLQNGNISEKLPYNSTTTIYNSDFINSTNVFTNDATDYHIVYSSNSSEFTLDNSTWMTETDKYLPMFGVNDEGWYVAILKNDGEWDIVYTQSLLLGDLSINVSNLNLHFSQEEYARTCDGYLRCRITYCRFNYQALKLQATSRYYVLDYLPQKINMAKSRIALTEEGEESYYRYVDIGLNKIEGTNRIIVSQLDEGEDYPYYYEINDFKKGYFTALVDKEYYSTFTITAYNSNGTTTSESFVLPPLEPVTSYAVNFSIENKKITVTPTSERAKDKQIIKSYEIKEINNIYKNKIQNGTYNNKERIDISNLKKGLYILTVTDIRGHIHSIKFSI